MAKLIPKSSKIPLFIYKKINPDIINEIQF